MAARRPNRSSWVNDHNGYPFNRYSGVSFHTGVIEEPSFQVGPDANWRHVPDPMGSLMANEDDMSVFAHDMSNPPPNHSQYPSVTYSDEWESVPSFDTGFVGHNQLENPLPGNIGPPEHQRQSLSRTLTQESFTSYNARGDEAVLEESYSRSTESSPTLNLHDFSFESSIGQPLVNTNSVVDAYSYGPRHKNTNSSSSILDQTLDSSPQGSFSQGVGEVHGQFSPGSDGSEPRDDPLYTAEPSKDGKYYCPYRTAGFRGESEPCTHLPQALKCSYDKQIDSHLRPYRCITGECPEKSFSSMACRLRHEREAHGLHGHKSYPCDEESCERHLNPFPRLWNKNDHMRRVHARSPQQSVGDQSFPEGDSRSRKRKPLGYDYEARKRTSNHAMSPLASGMKTHPRIPVSQSHSHNQDEYNTAMRSECKAVLRQVSYMFDGLSGPHLQQQADRLRHLASGFSEPRSRNTQDMS